MVNYTVQIKVRYEKYDEYVTWLKTEHIPEVLALPGFVAAELCLRKGGAMEASSRELQTTYKLESEDALKTYLAEYAMTLREKGLDKFPGMFSASREVWLETINFMSK